MKGAIINQISYEKIMLGEKKVININVKKQRSHYWSLWYTINNVPPINKSIAYVSSLQPITKIIIK